MNDPISLIVIAFMAGLIFQTFVGAFLYFAMQGNLREMNSLTKELFGLSRKIEGLNSSKREQVLREYDGLLESLLTRLPTVIAAHAGQSIFDTESRILSRLAELEPNLKTDEVGREKMNELISSMERLEDQLVSLTSDTVKKILVEARRDIFEDDQNLAA